MKFLSTVSILCALIACHPSATLANDRVRSSQTLASTEAIVQVTNNNDIPVPDGVPHKGPEINPQTGAC